ncbi:hypothetical protein AAG906_023131 [Vitis piasezkii]
MGDGHCLRDMVPFLGMVTVEATNVVLNVLFKSATSRGMSVYVFIVYSYAVATLILFPLLFIFNGKRLLLPPFKFSLLCKICSLGFIGFLAEIVAYKGIDYSSPTLASVIGNLTPALTFMLAIFFRMEKLALRSLSSWAKITGTIASISGALIVVLYKGLQLTSTSSPLQFISLHQPLNSQQMKWVIGGLLLVAEDLLVSIWYIVQAQVMEVYPEELVVVFLSNLCLTIISAPVCLIAEKNLSVWRVELDIALAAIVFSAFWGSAFGMVVPTWVVRLKGPVYVAMFNPLSIVIATAMGVMFLGDTLYLGSIIGAIVISIGFYIVTWGKAKEETIEDFGVGSLESLSNPKILCC